MLLHREWFLADNYSSFECIGHSYVKMSTPMKLILEQSCNYTSSYNVYLSKVRTI